MVLVVPPDDVVDSKLLWPKPPEAETLGEVSASISALCASKRSRLAFASKKFGEDSTAALAFCITGSKGNRTVGSRSPFTKPSSKLIISTPIASIEAGVPSSLVDCANAFIASRVTMQKKTNPRMR